MTDFLSCAACHGQRPRGLVSRRVVERPDVLSQLMDERQVARFLIAPPGYGKTTVALSYAQTVFNLDHVFWIEGGGPCFLRDLDAGDLAEEVIKRDAHVALVVLSHVPAVGTQRADELSRCIDVWLAHGAEVLVTLTPGLDSFARRQPDRVCITSAQLLLPCDDEGADEEDAAFDGRRIPALAWGESDAIDPFAWNLARESLPHDLAFLFFSVLVLGKAGLDDLKKLTRLSSADALASVLTYYPHLGYQPQAQAFFAMQVPVDSLSRAYRSRLPLLLSSSNAENVGEMLLQLAEVLQNRGQKERACDLVRLMAPTDPRRTWAIAYGEGMLAALKPFALYQLLDKVRYSATPEGVHLVMLQSLCLVMLGRSAEGCSAAVRVLRASAVTEADRSMAAFVLLRWGDVSQRQRALEDASKLSLQANAFQRIQLALSRDVASVLEEWESLSLVEAPEEELVLAAVLAAPLFPREMTETLAGYLGRADQKGELNLVQYEAIKVFREKDGMEHLAALVSPELMAAFFDAHTSLARQKAAFAALFDRTKPWTPPASSLKEYDTLQEPDAALLEVHLFGGLEVFVGGVLVDQRNFNRRQVRALLAILALNAGREVSLERLCSVLWPGTSRASNRKNFYAVWSILKHPFTSVEGTCPYFLHSRGGYRIDERLLQTDVQRVDDLCDELRFDELSPSLWCAHLKELERLCDGELLPGEDGNEMILSAREEYQVKVVNALTTASERLLESGEARTALIFAQSARKREKNREDVAYALAAAQYACGRREDALSTYLANKRYLADVFGIDPSPRMVRLYRSILEEEADF